MASRVRRRRGFYGRADSLRRPPQRSRAMLLLAGLAIGLALGALVAWLYGRSQTAGLSAELSHERARTEEKVALLEHAKADFSAKFDALAADALRKNNESFLALASGKVRPIEEALKEVEAQGALPR